MSSQSVLVIGGTGNSGRAIARQAASDGKTVAITYYSSESDANDVLEGLEGDGHVAFQCDVADADAVAETVDEVVETLETVDEVYYTSGVIARSLIEETDPETWANHMDVNVTGAFNVLRSLAPHLKAQGHGSVVGISASDAIQRNPELSAYNASKTGLNALFREAAREFAPSGVRANIVAPGPIREADQLSEDAKADLIESTPLSRICTPDDVAAVSLFLGSDAAASITGAVVPIDGGIGL